ncbi:hypothetical protein GR925_19220 [Streptomyces sp. HUCO-GS316]|uniref:hypothetical protein n=1 Tax=Streptomyces sp. HUCO-GS316 TaxID=2692198 RepID=UPI00136F5439|nr:hypothetical protein [Streptomyces sp. HUCO-GS316]MXM65525.1 hypothetical protein [Streptomyces sp. HUCO-GS316]
MTQMWSGQPLGECRTIVLDDVRWFNVMDLCDRHNITDASKAMRRVLLRDSQQITIATEFGPWRMWFVNERGAHYLVGLRLRWESGQ